MIALDISDVAHPKLFSQLPFEIYNKPYGNYVRMEDVLVDTRGYIYVSRGAQQGVWILKYTGPRK